MLQNTGMRLWKITTERTAMKKILALCLLLALLTGCAAVPQEESFAPAETERLVIYTSHKKEVWQPMVQAVNGTVVECNTAYDGARNTTEKHKELLKKQFQDGAQRG